MHEMPVTQSLLNMVLEHAEGQRVTDVYLRVGKMSSIVPKSVEVFFDYFSKDTLAQGARLHFEILPIEMVCQECQQPLDLNEWVTDPHHLVIQKAFARGCPCGSKNLRITGGVGCDLVSIEIEGG